MEYGHYKGSVNTNFDYVYNTDKINNKKLKAPNFIIIFTYRASYFFLLMVN